MKSAPKPASVYILVDPRSGRPRYVGCTNRPLARRLQDHMNQTTGERSTGALKDAWIKELIAAGRKPVIKHFANAPSLSEAFKIEDELIDQLKKLGENLVNIGPGKYERRKAELEEAGEGEEEE